MYIPAANTIAAPNHTQGLAISSNTNHAANAMIGQASEI
jgi:hypothetical protein